MIKEFSGAIITVIFLAIVTLIVPKGKCYGLIKWVVSIITVLVLIAPITSIIVDNSHKNKQISLQNEYIEANFSMQNAKNNELLTLSLEKLGIKNTEITTKYSTNEYSLVYKKVQINLKNAVINTDKLNIDIVQEITKIAKNIYGEKVLIGVNE